MDSFKFLLKRGDTVCAAVDGTTVLLEAIARRRPDFVRYLVVNASKLGLDVPRARDCHGRSALFHAAAAGSREIVDRLIEAGCSLLDEDRRGRTIVMEAAVHGRLDMLKYLAELAAKTSSKCGLTFHSTDDEGRNVLFYCVESGNTQVLDYVLSLGVHHRPDSSSRTILMQAARTGNPSMTLHLLNGTRSAAIRHLDPSAVDHRGESALHYGIRSGCGPVVAALLEDGRIGLGVTVLADLHKPKCSGSCMTASGTTPPAGPAHPLDVALDDPRLADVSRLLLDHLPSESGIGHRDRYGRTPLYRFVQHGQLGLLRTYAPGNYNAGDTDFDGKTLLMYACCHVNLDQRRTADIVKYIVEELGVHLTAVDNQGRTALFHAVKAGQIEATAFLLTRWSSSVVRSPSKSTNVTAEIISPSTVAPPLSSSSSSVPEPPIANLLADNTGRSLLMEAISSGRSRMISVLLESTISRQLVSMVDRDGRGPVHYWARQPEPDTYSDNCIVIASGRGAANDGAESDRSGSPGQASTPSGVPSSASSSSSSSSSSTISGSVNGSTNSEWRCNRSSILALLVAHRCDVNMADSRGGLTPLMYAARAGRSATVNALLHQLPRDLVRIDMADDDRRTALHHCCSGEDDAAEDVSDPGRRVAWSRATTKTPRRPPSLRCCQALVRAGVDVNAPDKAGQTALMLACQSYVPGANVSVIRYLVEHGGADPVRQDTEGRDSFDYCPPIDAEYARAVLREGAEMATTERLALRQFADRLIAMQHNQHQTLNPHHLSYASSSLFNSSSNYSSSSYGCSLHIASVLRGLVREGIFTRTLSFEVMKQAPVDRLRKLVDLLCCRGDRAFSAFCRVLKNEAAQPELAYMMMKAAYCRQQEIFC